jgi:two-component system, OmpR family, response regulator MprA
MIDINIKRGEPDMQRILVVDDDPAVTSVLRRGLSYEGFTVDTAASGHEGLAAARDHQPDLIILDIMMPDLDGFEVLRRIRSADPQLPVLMLTAKDSPSDQVEGLQSGADDYVIKPFTFEVLLARVHALLRRQDAGRPAILRFSDLSLDSGTRQAKRGDRFIDLTSTEYKLLDLLLEHPRQVLTRDILMDRVWGYDFGGDTNVLDTYIKQLRQKLEAGGETRLIHTVRGAGYVLRES